MSLMRYVRDSDKRVEYRAGETIFEQGEPGKQMFVLAEGQVDVELDGVVVATLEQGEMFGEMALVDDHPRSATARARTDCKVVAIDNRLFSFLVQATPRFALDVMRILANRLRHMNSLAT